MPGKPNYECIKAYVGSRVGFNYYFSLPYITTNEVFIALTKLDASKSGGLDDLVVT